MKKIAEANTFSSLKHPIYQQFIKNWTERFEEEKHQLIEDMSKESNVEHVFAISQKIKAVVRKCYLLDQLADTNIATVNDIIDIAANQEIKEELSIIFNVMHDLHCAIEFPAREA